MKKKFYVWYVVEAGYERDGSDGHIRPAIHFAVKPLRLHTNLKSVFLELDKTLNKDLADSVKEEFSKIKNAHGVKFVTENKGIDGTDMYIYCLHEVNMYDFMREFRDSADQWIKTMCKNIMEGCF
jgi:hypothetical protein